MVEVRLKSVRPRVRMEALSKLHTRLLLISTFAALCFALAMYLTLCQDTYTVVLPGTHTPSFMGRGAFFSINTSISCESVQQIASPLFINITLRDVRPYMSFFTLAIRAHNVSLPCPDLPAINPSNSTGQGISLASDTTSWRSPPPGGDFFPCVAFDGPSCCDAMAYNSLGFLSYEDFTISLAIPPDSLATLRTMCRAGATLSPVLFAPASTHIVANLSIRVVMYAASIIAAVAWTYVYFRPARTLLREQRMILASLYLFLVLLDPFYIFRLLGPSIFMYFSIAAYATGVAAFLS
jgi:hypothetical protein